MGIIHYLLENAERFPDKTAVIFDDVPISYREFAEKTRRLSGALSEIGLGKGSHIGLLLNNSVEFAITMFAAADLGLTIVPMNSTLSANDLLTAISVTDINFIIGWHATLKDVFYRLQENFPLSRQHCISVGGEIYGCRAFSEILNAVPEDYELGRDEISDETDFILTMTSGSTGAPKPIVFTQGTKIRRALGAQELYDITDKDVTLVSTPLYHSLAQRLLLMPIITGGTSVIMQKFTPNNWFTQVNQHEVTFSITVSSQLEMVLYGMERRGPEISSLRCIVSCCALLKNDIKRRLIKELGCSFHECYGTSEVGIVSNLAPEGPSKKLSSVGNRAPGVEIKIVDSERRPVAAGEIGEIICRTPMRFSRYYKNEQATQESMIDGFFYTEDMGYLDEDGYLVFSGRKKDIIITGGINVYPTDVEAVLNTHPRVKECAVIGVEDKRFGEAVLALVIPTEGEPLKSRELQRYCMYRLADFQQPLAYVFVQDFPRTKLGKVMKRKLAEQYRGYDSSAGLRAILSLEKNTKTYSCPSLHHAIFLAPDMLRHCCKRFFVNGQIRGDVKIYPVHNDDDIDVTRILKEKRGLYDAINRGEETPCSGCPFLKLDTWAPLDKLKIRYLSIESHTVCNMKCIYCSPTYYGGLKANYSLKRLFKHFFEAGAYAEDIDLVWGGGELTLMDDFEEIFQLFTLNLRPKNSTLFTNAIKYSPLIAKYLKDGKLTTLIISTDAGTKETFKKIRGVDVFDKVFNNIKKYHLAAGRGVIIKYVFTDGNSNLEEIKKFLEQINKYGLNKCHFQLSSDFKAQELRNEQAASVILLYKELVRDSANACHFDDHLRPRLNRKIKEILYSCNNTQKNEFQFIVDYLAEFQDKTFIVWGAGQLGYMMIKDSLLLEKSKIAFFVDKDEKKHGKLLCDIEIKHPDSIKEVDYPIVIGASRFYNEIYGELIDMGISENRIMGSLII